MLEFISAWLGSTPGFMFPLLFASAGLILCEKVGVLNLGAEGIMAVAAMVGAFCILAGQSVGFALIAGGLSAVVLGIPFVICVILLRAPQIPVGLAIVAIGLGASHALGKGIAHKTFGTVDDINVPFLSEIPIIGQFIFGQNIVIYLGIVLLSAIILLLDNSRVGLNMRAVGEDPASADSAGIDIQLYQITFVLLGIFILGIAGAYLSVVAAQLWTEGMINGRGWISVALVVFAQWSIRRAFVGALLFGAADALVPRLQAIGIDVPIYLLSMIPFVLTVIVLISVAIFFRSRSGEPLSLGKVYLRQSR